MNTVHVVKGVFALLGAWLGTFLGGWDGATYALIIFISLDYITGVMCAISEKNVSSDVGFKGIFRKVTILMLVGVGAILDKYIIGTGEVLRLAVIFYYISNEGISILENATRLGLPVPHKLQGVLEQLKEDEDDNRRKS